MFFKIKNKLGRARTGVINTKHGKILTPGFAFVATHGTIKSLDKKEHRLASPELTISNTFHLFEKIRKAIDSGKFSNWEKMKKEYEKLI